MAYKFQFGDAVMSGALEQEHGITVEAGGLTVTAGGLTVTAGGLNLDAGGADFNATGLTNVGAVSGVTSYSGSTSISADSLTLGSYGIATAGVATIASMGGNWTNASRTVADLGVITTVDINGGTIDGATIGGASAGAGTFAALVGTSLSVSDGNITNVGDINCDSVSVDDSAAGLDISFAGSSTGNNKLSLTDNLADALNITEAANSYIKFTTTDASELITFGQNSTFASTTIADLGTVTTATSITATDLIGTNIDGIIGAGTARAGSFTTIDATGATTLNGAVTLGDATADDLTFNGYAASNLVPKTDSAYDLGTTGNRWANLYVDSITGATVALTVESRAGGQTISSATGFALVTAGNGVTVTLPAASAGKELTVKLSSSIGDVILAAGSGDLVEGAANIRLESTGSAVKLTAYDGQSWFVS